MVAWPNVIRLFALGCMIVTVAQAQVPATEQLANEEGEDATSAFSGQDQVFAMLKLPHVRKELELIDSQEKKIDELITKMTETWSKMRTTIQEEVKAERKKIDEISDTTVRQEKLRKFNKLNFEIQKKQHELHEAASVLARKEIDDILLPQQRDRLKQLTIQKRANQRNSVGSPKFVRKNIPSGIELTTEQQEELRNLVKEQGKEYAKLQAEFREKTQKFASDWDGKFEDVLTPDQQKQWKSTIGEPFDFNQQVPKADAAAPTTKP